MALDITNLRRRLPRPPTDGSPAMDAPAADVPLARMAPGRSRPGPDADAAPVDGRSLRATGRTIQLNLKVSPETKARFLALAETRRVLLTDLFEQALDVLEAEETGG